MAIDVEELKEILKENLFVSVTFTEKSGSYGESGHFEVDTKVYFGEEEISTHTEYLNLPTAG